MLLYMNFLILLVPTLLQDGCHKMELSSKLKAMKFMKRKDDSDDRKQSEKEQQKSVERTHWTLNEGTTATTSTEPGNKPKFIIEYDYTGGLGNAGAVGRQSFKNYNKEIESSTSNSNTKEPVNKVPKLTESKK